MKNYLLVPEESIKELERMRQKIYSIFCPEGSSYDDLAKVMSVTDSLWRIANKRYEMIEVEEESSNE